MMSGAVWVRERLRACGWEFQIADVRKVKAIAPLACKTDRVDARVLAQLARRDLVPEVWVRHRAIGSCVSGSADALIWCG
jgi:transposase